jgi:hypothetical protein
VWEENAEGRDEPSPTMREGALPDESIALDGERAAPIVDPQPVDEVGVDVELMAVHAETAGDPEEQALAAICHSKGGVIFAAGQRPPTSRAMLFAAIHCRRAYSAARRLIITRGYRPEAGPGAAGHRRCPADPKGPARSRYGGRGARTATAIAPTNWPNYCTRRTVRASDQCFSNW